VSGAARVVTPPNKECDERSQPASCVDELSLFERGKRWIAEKLSVPAILVGGSLFPACQTVQQVQSSSVAYDSISLELAAQELPTTFREESPEIPGMIITGPYVDEVAPVADETPAVSTEVPLSKDRARLEQAYQEPGFRFDSEVWNGFNLELPETEPSKDPYDLWNDEWNVRDLEGLNIPIRKERSEPTGSLIDRSLERLGDKIGDDGWWVKMATKLAVREAKKQAQEEFGTSDYRWLEEYDYLNGYDRWDSDRLQHRVSGDTYFDYHTELVDIGGGRVRFSPDLPSLGDIFDGEMDGGFRIYVKDVFGGLLKLRFKIDEGGGEEYSFEWSIKR